MGTYAKLYIGAILAGGANLLRMCHGRWQWDSLQYLCLLAGALPVRVEGVPAGCYRHHVEGDAAAAGSIAKPFKPQQPEFLFSIAAARQKRRWFTN